MTPTHIPSPGRLDADGPPGEAPLPADDPEIFALDLRGLRHHWAARSALPPISAEAMTGADRRAQALGYPELRLMEHAGTAVAAAVRALATDLGRWGSGPIVILCGPGNNGGDGYVAARRLALNGAAVVVAVVASETRPKGTSSARNWDRIAQDDGITKVHLPVARDVAMFALGIEKAAVVVDALLGTGSAAPSASRSGPRSRSSARPGRQAYPSSRWTRQRRSTCRAASRPIRRSTPT